MAGLEGATRWRRAPARAAAAALLAAATALSGGCAATPSAPTPSAVEPATPEAPAPAPSVVDAVTPGAPAPSAAEPVTPSTSPRSFAELAARFTDRALAQVRAGDLRRAIDSWRVVAALRPDAAEPRRQIEELTARLAAEAERREGDAGKRVTPAAVAEPALSPEEAEGQLAEAGELLAAGVFEAAAATAERLVDIATVGSRARRLAGDAWFAAGEAALRHDRLPDALAAFRKAEPVRPDAAARAASAERLARERAEEQYNEGVRHFVEQNLDAAIRSWERALALNPAHPNAARDIAKARELQQKLREIR